MSSNSKGSRQLTIPQDDKEEEEWTENDIIRCICGDDEEDGLMIQCNHCLAWLHCGCVNISSKDIPTRYKCEYCKKSKRKNPSITEQQKSQTHHNDFPKAKARERLKPQSSSFSSNNEQCYAESSKVSKKKFTQITKSIIDDKTIKEMYRDVRKRWQQYQTAKDSLDPLQKVNMESYKIMEHGESLCPSIPKASVKPLQKSLHRASFSSQKDPSIQKGIFADVHIQDNKYLLEIVGQVIKKSKYKKDEKNRYSTILTPLPHVFFHRTLDLCVDSRYIGNHTRFVRRACHPNSEVKTIILPNEKDSESLHLGIYTRKEVSRGEEITIPWSWPKNHVITKKKIEFMKQEIVELDDDMMPWIKDIIDVFEEEYGGCACEDKDECFIEFLKDEIKNNEAETKKQRQQKQKRPRFQKIQKVDTKYTEDVVKGTPVTSGLKRNRILKCADSTDEEQPKRYTEKNDLTDVKYLQPSIPPSPADSVEDSAVVHNNALVDMDDRKLPMKKIWLRRFLKQKSFH